jgi:hypothetical protein
MLQNHQDLQTAISSSTKEVIELSLEDLLQISRGATAMCESKPPCKCGGGKSS